ncbi:MAG: reverse transcriptase/maturase family protein [Patescibacteria group bacterium]|nr:reverse transcriptase/maturase family protein [Patescibacteria group bacterium]
MFERNLEDNLFELHRKLCDKTYKHGEYISFYITDPKIRHIHKATIQDRIIHHAVYRALYPIFDKSFIFDSYSCRIKKGTHCAIKRFEVFSRKASENYMNSSFVLKCDIRKFFASVDHEILKRLIRNRVKDKNVLWLMDNIIDSFETKTDPLALTGATAKNKGIPIGNLTSQLFANIYLNELDQYIKHSLRLKYYIRYCDDFVILSNDEEYLNKIKEDIGRFVSEKLNLRLHKDKVMFRKLYQGIDFLGYITSSRFRVLRTKTKRKMFKRVTSKNISSYLGVLNHCNGRKLEEKIKSMIK